MKTITFTDFRKKASSFISEGGGNLYPVASRETRCRNFSLSGRNCPDAVLEKAGESFGD